MVASASDQNAMVMETRAGYTAYFGANDIRCVDHEVRPLHPIDSGILLIQHLWEIFVSLLVYLYICSRIFTFFQFLHPERKLQHTPIHLE